MKKEIYCGLDIGGHKICAICAQLEPSGKIDILGSCLVPAEGIESGRVTDSLKLTSCIRAVVFDLRKISGVKIKRVYVNIDTSDLRVKIVKKRLTCGQGNRVQKKTALVKLVKAAVLANIPQDRRVIYTDVRGPIFEKQLTIAIISAQIPRVNALKKCLKDAGLIVRDLLPSVCAQARAFYGDFPQNAKDDCLLIDVGAALTKIALFRNGLVNHIAILPCGAQNITADIAVKLKLSFDCAEQLKIKYARLDSHNQSTPQQVIIRDKLANRAIALERLQEITNSRSNYLIAEIKKALPKLNDSSDSRVKTIVTGGGAVLDGFLERAEEILARPIKMGFLSGVGRRRIQVQSAFYATAVGLIRYGFARGGKKTFSLRFRAVPWAEIWERFSRLYREYF